MRLRPSPVKFRDLCNWPPALVRLGRVNGNRSKTTRGEMGILKDVRCHRDRPGRIYLTVEHDGALTLAKFSHRANRGFHGLCFVAYPLR